MALESIQDICRLTLRVGRPPILLTGPEVHTRIHGVNSYLAQLEIGRSDDQPFRLALLKNNPLLPNTQDLSLVVDFNRFTLSLRANLRMFPETTELEDPVSIDPERRTLIENGTYLQGKIIDEEKERVVVRGYVENFGPNAAMMVRVFSEEALNTLRG